MINSLKKIDKLGKLTTYRRYDKTYLKDWIKYALIIMLIAIGTTTCTALSYRNINNIKANAPIVFRQAGFNIVGYEGYQIGDPISGVRVWFIPNKTNNTNITYSASIEKWFNEYRIYNLKAINAIKP